jgi:cytochrome c oxidase cbb3-type subunit 4
MDIGIFRGILTAVLMALFIALVIWAYSRRRHDEFSEAAQLPLGDDRAPPSERASRGERPSPSERRMRSGTEQS